MQGSGGALLTAGQISGNSIMYSSPTRGAKRPATESRWPEWTDLYPALFATFIADKTRDLTEQTEIHNSPFFFAMM